MFNQSDYGYSIDGQPTIDWSIKVEIGVQFRTIDKANWRVCKWYSKGLWECRQTEGNNVGAVVRFTESQILTNCYAD